MGKRMLDVELLKMVAERLRQTQTFQFHSVDESKVDGSIARIGDLFGRGGTHDAALMNLAQNVASRLDAQIDHDVQLLRRLRNEIRSFDPTFVATHSFVADDASEPDSTRRIEAVKMVEETNHINPFVVGQKIFSDEVRPTVIEFSKLIERELRNLSYSRASWKQDGAKALCGDLDALVDSFRPAASRGTGPHMTPARLQVVRENAVRLAAQAMAIADCCGALDVPDGEE